MSRTRRWLVTIAGAALLAGPIAAPTTAAAAPADTATAAADEPIQDPLPDPVTVEPRPHRRGVRAVPQDRTRAAADRSAAHAARAHQLPRRGARRLRPPLRARPQRPGVPHEAGRGAARLPRPRLDLRARLLLRPRPGHRLRVRRLPPRLRAQRQVLHRAQRERRRPREADHLAHAAQPDPARGGHRVDRRRPGRRHVQRHPPRGHAHRFHRPGPRHPADRLQPDGPAGATATTASSTSPPATAGRAPPPPGRRTSPPLRQDPAHRPAGHRRHRRPVRHPARQPVRRRRRRARRDLRDRHARPAPVQLGPGHRADVPRPHRRAPHRGRLRGPGRRQLRLERAGRAVRLQARRPAVRRLPVAGRRRAVRLRLPGGRVRPQPAARPPAVLGLRPRDQRRLRLPRPRRAAAARQVRVHRPRGRPGVLHRGRPDAPRPADGPDPRADDLRRRRHRGPRSRSWPATSGSTCGSAATPAASCTCSRRPTERCGR